MAVNNSQTEGLGQGFPNKSFKLLKMVEQANLIVLTKIVRVLIDYGHEIRVIMTDE